MYFWCKNSSHQVFRHTKMGENDYASVCLHTGRNMICACQLFLREHYQSFEISGVTIEGLCEKVQAEYFYQEPIVFADGLPSPDRMSRKEPVIVPPNVTQGIYVIFHVQDAQPGLHSLKCTVHTSEGDYTADIVLVIHRATLPEPKDSVLNLEYFYDCTSSFNPQLRDMNNPFIPYYKYEPGVEAWWTYVANLARCLKKLRVNSMRVPIYNFLDGYCKRVSEKEWAFDFSMTDKMIELFLENGSFSHITMANIVDPLDASTVDAFDENGQKVKYDLKEGKDAEWWLIAFYTAIYNHFKEKGWLGMLLMHLQDEPHQTEYWLQAQKLCKKCMPGVITTEPIDTPGIGEGLGDAIDIAIPRLEVFEKDKTYYKKRIEEGKELWTYSCCFPDEPWWLNRFIGLPHSYTTLIMWGCFTQKIKGFLHWGLNSWHNSDPLFEGTDTPFKGDPYLIYPDVENLNVLPSARAIASVIGAQDYELLHLLAQTMEDASYKISSRVASSFREFSDDPDVIENAREEVLTLLDAKLS